MNFRVFKVLFPVLTVSLAILISCSTDSINQTDDNSVVNDSDKIPWEDLTGVVAFYSNSSICGSCLGLIELSTREFRHVPVKSNFLEAGVILYYLTWTNHPSRLAFINDTKNGESSLIQIDTEGNTEILYSLEDLNLEAGPPAWSSDGRIAYQVNNRIHTYLDLNDDNLNELRIDHKPFMSAYIDHENPYNNRFFLRSRPAWSPDGEKLVVSVSNRRDYSALWSINVADSTYTILIEAEGDYYFEEGLFENPSFSPDGSKITFNAISPDDPWVTVWMVNHDGSQLRLLTSERGTNSVWSANGDYILYNSLRYDMFNPGYDGNYHTSLYLLKSDGGQPIQFTPNSFNAWWPAWKH
jgi:hypothetical protein